MKLISRYFSNKVRFNKYVRGEAIIVVEVNTVTKVQNLNKAFCILHNTNVFEKGMNPTIFPPDMGE